MTHHFQAGEAARKRAVQQVLVRYIVIAVGFSCAFAYLTWQGMIVVDSSFLVAMGVITVFLTTSLALSLRRARKSVEGFLLTLDDEGLSIQRGAYNAHVRFEQISHVVRRPDRGLAVYLKDRQVPFLLLTPRIENFALLEELIAARVKIVEGKANAFFLFNHYLWMIGWVAAILVFLLSLNLVVIIVSGALLCGLVLFSGWLLWTNRKNMKVKGGMFSLLFLLVVIVLKLMSYFHPPH